MASATSWVGSERTWSWSGPIVATDCVGSSPLQSPESLCVCPETLPVTRNLLPCTSESLGCQTLIISSGPPSEQLRGDRWNSPRSDG